MPKSKISLMKKRLTCRPPVLLLLDGDRIGVCLDWVSGGTCNDIVDHRDCGIAHQMLLRHGQCVAFVPVVIRVWRLDAFVHTHYDVIRES